MASSSFVISLGRSYTNLGTTKSTSRAISLLISSLIHHLSNALSDISVITIIVDPSKATKELKWKAKSHWKELVELMIDEDMAAFKK
jgi:GDP-D-mannose dehydratase